MGERESRGKFPPGNENKGNRQEPFSLAIIAAETMYYLWELDYLQGNAPDLDAKMRRLKDLSAYSLTHAEMWDTGIVG